MNSRHAARGFTVLLMLPAAYVLSGIQPAAQEVPIAAASTANRPLEAAGDDPDQGGTATESADPSEGLWPSRKLLRLTLTRIVDDACDRYALNDTQRDAVRTAMIDRWYSYLTEHRAELQPLLNEFLEVRMGLDPPDVEQVRSLAERAAPVFARMREQLEESWETMREVLTPVQRARFEIETLAARAGLEFAASRLDRWRQGSFEINELWEPRDRREQQQVRQERRRRRIERQERIESQIEAARPDQIDQELDRWEQHVADFIATYELDEGQRSTALSMLAELKGRASAHRDRYLDEIAALERRINNPATEAGGDEDRAAIKAELVRLYGPIDEMFADLDRRLQSLPTQSQRAAASRREDERTDQTPHKGENPAKPDAASRPTEESTASPGTDGKH